MFTLEVVEIGDSKKKLIITTDKASLYSVSLERVKSMTKLKTRN